MKKSLLKYVVKLLRETADKIDTGNCELSEQEALDLISVFGHEALSKDSACRHLNMSRSKFDNLVLQGKLPRGKKRRGFKELIYYKDELDNVVW